MSKKLPDLGPLEMQALGIIEASADLSVSEVQQALKQRGQSLAYTTVMTVLVRLLDKGLVSRRKQGRQFLYTVEKKKGFSPIRVLERVKNSLFGSDRLKPILSLIDLEEELTESQLQELKRSVEAKLKKARKK